MSHIPKVKKGSSEPRKPKLARPGDPYVMPNGRLIKPEGVPVLPDESPVFLPAEFKPSKQRSIRDLPATPQVMNGIICVLVYTLMGLSVREIAEVLSVTTEAVDRAKEHAAYSEVYQTLSSEFVNVNSENIQARIAAYGQGALTSLANIALCGKQESNQLRASVDLLDRGGHSKKMSGGVGSGDDLRITIIRGDETVDVKIGDIGGM